MISHICDVKSATLLLIYQKCDLVPLLRSRRTEVSPNNNDINNNNNNNNNNINNDNNNNNNNNLIVI